MAKGGGYQFHMGPPFHKSPRSSCHVPGAVVPREAAVWKSAPLVCARISFIGASLTSLTHETVAFSFSHNLEFWWLLLSDPCDKDLYVEGRIYLQLLYMTLFLQIWRSCLPFSLPCQCLWSCLPFSLLYQCLSHYHLETQESAGEPDRSLLIQSLRTRSSWKAKVLSLVFEEAFIGIILKSWITAHHGNMIINTVD